MKSLAEAESSSSNGGNHPSNSISTTPKWPSSRRTPSLSSVSSASNSSSSFHTDSPPASPCTPLHRFSTGGIPFSWESIPGIPKKQTLKKTDSSRSSNSNHLPLPPRAAPVSTSSATKSGHKKRITSRRDPFYTALVECSKSTDAGAGAGDGDDKAVFGSIFKGPKQGRSLSDRFGFVNNMSCKTSSVVSESLVLLPTRGPRRIAYDFVKKRSG